MFVGDSKVVMPDVSSFKGELEKAIEAVVEDTVACPRYTGITISNIKVDESPKWLKNRLLSIGVNPQTM
ncbi:MAG: hypothetical protein IPN88_04710 [Bacteroidetes bacterium]|nr:hypothetical protein [Bacteroidota bacterium]